MTAPGEPVCSRCGSDRWSTDRYCGRCGIALAELRDELAGPPGAPDRPQISSDTLGDSADSTQRRRWLALGLVAVLAIVGLAAWTLSRSDDDRPEATTESEAVVEVPTTEVPTPSESTSELADPTTMGTPAPTPSTADLTIDRSIFDNHALGDGQIVVADGQEAKLIDLATGDVTTMFSDVNFFEIAAIGEHGVTQRSDTTKQRWWALGHSDTSPLRATRLSLAAWALSWAETM